MWQVVGSISSLYVPPLTVGRPSMSRNAVSNTLSIRSSAASSSLPYLGILLTRRARSVSVPAKSASSAATRSVSDSAFSSKTSLRIAASESVIVPMPTAWMNVLL